MKTKHAALAALLLSIGSIAKAESVAKDVDFSQAAFKSRINMTCTFKTECIDADACEDTTFAGSLAGQGGGPTADDLALLVTFTSDSMEQEFIGTATKSTYKLMNIVGTANNMMTITPDGTAHHTVHLPNVPMAITYIGTCKDAG